VAANHTIRFTLPSGSVGLGNGETLTITFPDGFNLATSSVDYTDVDLLVGGSQQTLDTSPSGATWGVSVSGQDLIFTAGSSGLSADDSVVIYIGTNASSSETGDNQIINHAAAGSYKETITLPDDTGYTRVVILDDVNVTATVDTVFDFTVSGFNTSGIAVNGTSTTATTTSTAIPFGTLTAGHIVTAAQRLNVSTNAKNGFVVTVQQSGNLQSATGADIDGFIDGEYDNTPQVWQAPSASIGDEKTWGHWGITSSDDLNSSEFASNKWVAASTTPRQIFENNGPADGATANSGSTTVGFQVEISALQEAADDYSTTLTYVATPTF
jgi:hypothetical protein